MARNIVLPAVAVQATARMSAAGNATRPPRWPAWGIKGTAMPRSRARRWALTTANPATMAAQTTCGSALPVSVTSSSGAATTATSRLADPPQMLRAASRRIRAVGSGASSGTSAFCGTSIRAKASRKPISVTTAAPSRIGAGRNGVAQNNKKNRPAGPAAAPCRRRTSVGRRMAGAMLRPTPTSAIALTKSDRAMSAPMVRGGNPQVSVRKKAKSRPLACHNRLLQKCAKR
ncbi:hypothetical protein GCM10009102_05110 [Sphingomonas insulae]|uniref:Uncharacterized protein n=1 Tax=Sphingomonas insulae TaxID=424800 RepID=A0ABN1HMW3_9SPHN